MGAFFFAIGAAGLGAASLGAATFAATATFGFGEATTGRALAFLLFGMTGALAEAFFLAAGETFLGPALRVAVFLGAVFLGAIFFIDARTAVFFDGLAAARACDAGAFFDTD